MFKRYWREYPFFLQMVLFVLMFYTLGNFSLYLISVLLAKFQGGVADMTMLKPGAPLWVLQQFIWKQAVASLGAYALTSLVFAYLSHPRPAAYLGLRKIRNGWHLVLIPLIVVGAIVLFTGLEELVRGFNWSNEIRQTQARTDQQMEALFGLKGTGNLLVLQLVFALIPALGEELFFRGMLMRFAARRSRTMLFPVVMSATLFAFAHDSVFGLLSILLAGVMLSLIYWWTGSLWAGIIAHFLFNGLQILLQFLARGGYSFSEALKKMELPAYLPVAGALVMGLGLYLLWKTRTPLPRGWANDFTPEEMAAREDRPPFPFV